jgi:hypothetical protein
LNLISNRKADFRNTRTLKATLRMKSFEFKSNLSLLSIITPNSLVLVTIGINISLKINCGSAVCLVVRAPFEKKIAFAFVKLSNSLLCLSHSLINLRSSVTT